MPRHKVVPPKADKQHRWSGHRKIVNQQGYVKVRVGKTHPLADPNGYAYEHLVVWCAAGNPRPATGTVLHHRNEVRDDNRIENLELLSRTEHGQHHAATLTDAQVRDIREAYAARRQDMPQLAATYSVSAERISRFIRGQTRRAAGGPILVGDKRNGKPGRLLDGIEHNGMPGDGS